MSLGRLVVLKNLQRRLASTTSPSSSSASLLRSRSQRLLLSERTANNPAYQKQRCWSGSDLQRRWLSSAPAGEENPEGKKEVAVSGGDKKSKLFPRRRRGRSLWRRDHDVFHPAFSGLGNALVQAAENINKVLGKLSPSRLMGRLKEQEDCYKLKYYVPGLTKEDVKVTVEHGVLTIKGERMEEETEESEDDNWSGMNYFGYYNANIMLPEDAKVDEIKAEMKNGVLTIIIPRNEEAKKDVKEIQVN